MSYHSTVDGRFYIEPPLSATELRELTPFTDSRDRPYAEIEIGVTEQVKELPEGDLHVKQGIYILPREPNSEWSRTRSAAQIQQVVDQFGSTHKFTGFMEFLGEDGKRWRLYVDGDQVIRVDPTITWEVPA